MADFKLLTFLLGEETYGIPISKIKEIIGILPITRIPHSPEFLKGIINLRGSVIPVIDLRCKLGFEEVPYNERTCILIVDITSSGVEKSIGVIVDIVSEVINISDKEIEGPECCGRGDNKENDYIQGIGKLQNKNLIILDIERMFSNKELTKMLESAK